MPLKETFFRHEGEEEAERLEPRKDRDPRPRDEKEDESRRQKPKGEEDEADFPPPLRDKRFFSKESQESFVTRVSEVRMTSSLNSF